MSEILQIRREGRLLCVALNRPEKRNALNVALCNELVAALDQAASDGSVGAVLLSGNGKAFCAGMDLSEVLSGETGAIHQVHEQLFTIGVRLTKPVVAAVHGATLAGGMGLVTNCHVVVASEDATFGLTEIRLGLWPLLIFRSLALAIGERRATELSLTARIFGAQEALQYGLIHHVGGPEQAEGIAAALAKASPSAVQTGLWFVQEMRGQSWKDAGELGRRLREELFRSADFQEGIRAFQEKRAPRWPSLRE